MWNSSCAAGAVWARFVLVVALAAPIWAHAQSAPAAAPIPIEAFFDRPGMHQAALSPSGRHLASLSAVGGSRVGFTMIDLTTMEQRFVQAGTQDDVIWFAWVSDEWLVFTVGSTHDRDFVYDAPGTGLMAMRRDGSESRMIVARTFRTVGNVGWGAVLDANHAFVGLGAPGSNEIVLAEYSGVDPADRVYRNSRLKAVDVATRVTRRIAVDGPQATRWWLDAKGRARVARASDGRQVTYWWASVQDHWQQILSAPLMEVPFTPAYVAGDGELVVHTVDKRGFLELRRFDFEKGAPANDVMLTTPGFDGPVTPRRQRDSGVILGVEVLLEAATPVWFARDMARLQETVDQRLQGQANAISCAPCTGDAAQVLVHSWSDRDPGRYVLYRPARNQWLLVGETRPKIDPARMSELAFERIVARDGRDLPVWVTQPTGGAAGRPGPAVVLVHGGPWMRGTKWEWDAERQFLASRGYVVIEPEFRGSTGYGLLHERAGWKQWGRAMQDDVSDALRMAIDKGLVDPGRVCIMGGSFGGYAALMGLVRDPQQYRCGVALAAVSDPRHMYEFHWSDLRQSVRAVSLPAMLGDPRADDALLTEGSPLVHAARIQAPVLLVHGGADRRVPVENGERMRDAMRKLGKPVEWVLYPDEGHNFNERRNLFDYWRRVEAFLAQHLKPQ